MLPQRELWSIQFYTGLGKMFKYKFIMLILIIIFGFVSLYSHNITFSNMAFFSVLLYPFLEWLDLSVKIPQNASSTLLFGMLQCIMLYLLSYLLEQLK